MPNINEINEQTTNSIPEDTKICACCGEIIREGEEYTYNGQYYCSDCVTFCEHCDVLIKVGDTFVDEGATYIKNIGVHWCTQCTLEHAHSCDECGDWFTYELQYVNGNSEGHYCNECFDNMNLLGYISYCDHCGEWYDAETVVYEQRYNMHLCHYCFEALEASHLEASRTAIHNYGYKPNPIFHKLDENEINRFIGVELEIDKGGKNSSKASQILAIANCNSENIYIKSDSSLDEGLEIVTHPMTWDYHINAMPWEKILQKCRELGYKSHDTDTCGLHFHINRDYFGNVYTLQESCIAKIVYFFEVYYDYILKFARRTQETASRWAGRYKNTIAETIKTVASKDDFQKFFESLSLNNRYRAINLENEDTIEFRIFKGTLKYSTFIMALKFVIEICDCAKFMSDEEFFNMTFKDFILKLDKENPELSIIDYCKSKDIEFDIPLFERFNIPLKKHNFMTGMIFRDDIMNITQKEPSFENGDTVELLKYTIEMTRSEDDGAHQSLDIYPATVEDIYMLRIEQENQKDKYTLYQIKPTPSKSTGYHFSFTNNHASFGRFSSLRFKNRLLTPEELERGYATVIYINEKVNDTHIQYQSTLEENTEIIHIPCPIPISTGASIDIDTIVRRQIENWANYRTPDVYYI